MKQAIWLWIKRGVFTIAAIFTLAAISSALFLLKEKHRLAQFNRTHQRPLLVDARDPVLIDAHALLAHLQTPKAANSLQFAAMPSFGKRWFAISLSETGTRSMGEVIVTTLAGQVLRQDTFVVPRDDLALFLRRWDEITDGYSGEGRLLTDGTPLAFERRRAGAITSGEGNSPCHYDVLGDLAAQALGRYVPELADLRDPTLPAKLRSNFCNRSIFALR
ncbi:hypothetical protein [Novosphingobium pokkalii]|uniref:Uncharacterized protein n=1 Tax=Novosphingobium pokkalii TaxID=1770194 RepID=A0ABV7V717_9SPHN|nr:hypothetical protein [Novosphingobium pokkalii]